jgi:hypothetical protein
MNGQEKFDRFLGRHPHPHKVFFDRPHWTRRQFFEIVGAGVTGSFLAGKAQAQGNVQITSQSVTMQNKARNVIFILLAGAPSHTDTFDLKMVDGVTPSDFNPTTISGVLWPAGLLPNLANNIPDMAIVRSMKSWALVHSLAQTWTQIGRNPAAALGDIAPNVGSIVAIEKASERRPDQVFPTFLALNSASGIGAGYLPAAYAPFRVNPSAAGVPNLKNPDDRTGAGRMAERWSLLHSLDDRLRVNSPLGQAPEDMDDFYQAAKGMMYNPVVDKAFGFTSADSQRYGGNGFGNACLVAKQVLEMDQGTRFIQITLGGWDMHQDIYGKNNPKGNNLYTLGKIFDNGASALLADLKSSGLIDNTLVVMVGEFGRTVGKLSGALGRDHYTLQSIAFAGAGVHGGRTLGVTNDAGSDVLDFGWSRDRYVRPEDVEATIYSAMGINWTTVRYDDPFHRGFYYVPFSDQDVYGPVNELWA